MHRDAIEKTSNAVANQIDNRQLAIGNELIGNWQSEMKHVM